MRRLPFVAACTTAVMVLLFSASTAHAAPFSLIRIGDVDGFGFLTPGLVRATAAPHTTPADTNLNGLLEAGEYLPDINKNGSVAVNSGDYFDNRSASEIADSLVTGAGFINDGSTGSNETDLSLGLGNQPSFLFKFKVAVGDIDPS